MAVGSLYVVTMISISKQYLSLDKMHQMKDICHQLYILNRYKRSHDTENHCGYLIILDLAKSPFVKSIEIFSSLSVKHFNIHCSNRQHSVVWNFKMKTTAPNLKVTQHQHKGYRISTKEVLKS